MPAFATIWRDSNSKNRMRRATLAARAASSLTAVLRPLILALLMLAALPAVGSAAVSKLALVPEGGADFGDTQAVTGKVTGRVRRAAGRAPGGAGGPPLPVQATVRADRDGDDRPRRPLRLRARASTATTRCACSSPRRGAQRVRGRLRLPAPRPDVLARQAQRHPDRPDLPDPQGRQADRSDALLRRPGREADVAARPPRARRARSSARRKRVPGRFRASADVRLPAAWKGRFRYASCFPYNAGMGNPKLGCPKRRYKF